MGARRHLGGKNKAVAGRLVTPVPWRGRRQRFCCPLVALSPAVRASLVPEGMFGVGFQLCVDLGDILGLLPTKEFFEMFCSLGYGAIV